MQATYKVNRMSAQSPRHGDRPRRNGGLCVARMAVFSLCQFLDFVDQRTNWMYVEMIDVNGNVMVLLNVERNP